MQWLFLHALVYPCQYFVLPTYVSIPRLVDLLYLSACFALVSLSEEQLDSRGKVELEDQVEEEEETEEETPLVALAPDASLPEEQPSASTDVSASPPFQCLDEVRLINVVDCEWHFGSLIGKTNITFGSCSDSIYLIYLKHTRKDYECFHNTVLGSNVSVYKRQPFYVPVKLMFRIERRIEYF